MNDNFIFTSSLEELDPSLKALLSREDKRQAKTIILIASESMAPAAVQEAMSGNFANIYAEGYPRPESRQQSETELLDFDAELAHYRRYSDPRYYKGVEYADILEALTRRRAAELFAANGISPDNLYVNVQPLSGAPANNALYSALLQPGDTIMGLDLKHGGHLSHGSKINRSGKVYNAVNYTVDPVTEQLDYDAIEALALEVRPQIIVAGYSAYPCVVDWLRFRQIADKCGAYLMADIAHISGLVAAGVHPSPIGIAQVVTTTTHKSLCGPRGAMVMTHDKNLSAKIDRAVFPGEQGGPHLNTMAALALALKLAGTEQFRQLQMRIVHNATRLAEQLQERGLRIVAGGTETHLLLIDTKSVEHNGVHLSGDMAARILDVAGIVTNRNTIPGDKSALATTGVRIGTVWISQLGYGDAEIDLLAEAIASTLHGCRPFAYAGLGGKELLRAVVDHDALVHARQIVHQLTGQSPPAPAGEAVEIRGEIATNFLNYALTSDVLSLAEGQSQPAHIFSPGGDAGATLTRFGPAHYQLHFTDAQSAQAAAAWLQDLSDGYVHLDDAYAKLPGPVVVTTSDSLLAPSVDAVEIEEAFADSKPYYVGQQKRLSEPSGLPLPEFSWQEPAGTPLRRTSLYDVHVSMGARLVPFGGWDMPVWYTSVSEEHAAVRQAAGLFDVSHMGVLEVSGPQAAEFLNVVATNDVNHLPVGKSHYSFFLFPDGRVVDDLFVYRRGPERFMLVVNASNNDKDWAWLNAVNEGEVQIDPQRPWVKVQQPAVLRDLRDRQWGDECRVDIALQGPRATDILLSLCGDPALARRIAALPWASLLEGVVAGLNLVIARTGYTGERTAYELFVHPDRAPELWQALLEVGEPLGLKPCGLAARDSTRTEAGLPLYGHELAGPLELLPGDAGFASYVKLWKPFFIGRAAFIAHEEARHQIVVRFRMNEKGVRRPELGDPVLDRRGKVVGTVTSCAIDSEGYLSGQAVVSLNLSEEGTPLYIYQLAGGNRELKVPPTVKPGARLPIPDGATVLSRFPRRK